MKGVGDTKERENARRQSQERIADASLGDVASSVRPSRPALPL